MAGSPVPFVLYAPGGLSAPGGLCAPGGPSVVQIIRGTVSDPDSVRPVVDRWMNELGPTADGWLGSTSGVTGNNQLFVLVRFESEEAARANSDKPEQGQLWAEMEKLLQRHMSILFPYRRRAEISEPFSISTIIPCQAEC